MSARWPAVTERPRDYPAGADTWFRGLARTLVGRVELVAGDAVVRPAEVEVYDHGPGHPDPFAHRDPVQLTRGAWYFHRTRGSYRGGSFKGVDLAFGGGGAYSGVLFRALALPDGTRVDGPSLSVDFVLKATGFPTVAALDRAIGGRPAWDATNPLHLRDAAPLPLPDVLECPRVGLSLKTHTPATMNVALDYLFRPYRTVSDPRRTKTGKPHLAATLLLSGEDVAAVAARTGVPRAAVGRYAAALEAGRAGVDASGFLGRPLSSADWVRLFGWWSAAREIEIPASLSGPDPGGGR